MIHRKVKYFVNGKGPETRNVDVPQADPKKARESIRKVLAETHHVAAEQIKFAEEVTAVAPKAETDAGKSDAKSEAGKDEGDKGGDGKK